MAKNKKQESNNKSSDNSSDQDFNFQEETLESDNHSENEVEIASFSEKD